MELCDFVVPEAILPGLTVKSKADAIRGMVESLTACGRIDTKHGEGIISAILKREDTHTAEPHTITAFCLLALAVALFYQARRAKINPETSLY